jgi:sulfatase modifying factor 1
LKIACETLESSLLKGFAMIGANKIIAVLVLAGSTSSMASAAATPGDIDARVQNLVTKVKSTLMPMPAGTFDMGDWGTESGQYWDSDPYSRPLHKVTLEAFSMMAYKVTFEDFDVFTDATGKERIHMDPYYLHERAPKRAAGVSWYGARAYCQWLGDLTHLSFELPTEAQWEYAARSGGKRVLFGTDNGKIERSRNYPRDWMHGEAEPPLPDVGSFPPNPAGIYGMTENAQEWVMDWFDPTYYAISPEVNPTGPETGIKKVQRGSVDGKPEIAAMVFMRGEALPQTLKPTLPNGNGKGFVMVRFSGYSSHNTDNFRCALATDQNRN